MIVSTFRTDLPTVMAIMTMALVKSTSAFFTDSTSTSTSCTIMGNTYTVGDPIENFQTRCGTPQEYPCFCDPTQDPPISCPYCTFAIPDDGLLCLSVGDTETFTDYQDVQMRCSCGMGDDGLPAETCGELPDISVSETTTTISQAGSDTCTLDLPGGDTFTFERNEIIDDVLPNRCGEGFPCFCNPDLPGSIECPYCRFVDEDGDLLCASDGETVSFRDEVGEQQSCFCDVPADPRQDPVSSCTAGSTNGGSSGGNDSENNDDRLDDNDDFSDDRFGNNDQFNDDRFDDNDDFSDDRFGNNEQFNDDRFTNDDFSSNNDDRFGDQNDNENVDNGDVCTFETEDGEFVNFQRGESYGNYVETRCGTSFQFPCYCNPDMVNQLECPYCAFVQDNGDLLCAKHQEVVSFNDGEDDVTCSCVIPNDPSQEPIKSCGEGGIPPPTNSPVDGDNDGEGCSIMDEDGFMVTIPEGGSFGNLIEGVCGDSSEWPSFCNTDPQNTVVSRQGSQEFDFIEYPYCVFSDTRSGDTVCARDGEEIVYTNSFGEEVECSCSYVEVALGGAQSTCETLGGSPSQPTQPTPSPPTFAPIPNSAGAPSWMFGKQVAVTMVAMMMGALAQ